jgi:CheY-like chemotaxis protein
LGIGLTLVKRLVEMHSGSIEVSSAGLNQGSEFKVRLPLFYEVREMGVDEDGESSEKKPVTSRALKILVVDDNEDAANMLQRVLKSMGHNANVAYDGEAAIPAATSMLPDLILMDLGMPKLNGYEAAGQIRSQEWGKPIVLVALTGWGQEEDKQRTQAAGFDMHLVKPIEPSPAPVAD